MNTIHISLEAELSEVKAHRDWLQNQRVLVLAQAVVELRAIVAERDRHIAELESAAAPIDVIDAVENTESAV